MDSEKRDQERVNIDYIAYEGACARLERVNKRLWISNIIDKAVIIIIIGLFLWLLYGSNFESYEYEQDGSGINIIGDENEGVKQYGAASESEEDNENERGETYYPQGENQDG